MITLSATTLRCDNAKHVFCHRQLGDPSEWHFWIVTWMTRLASRSLWNVIGRNSWTGSCFLYVFNRWNISMVNWSRRYPTLSSRCYLQKLAIPRHQPVPGVFLWSVGSFQDVEAKPPDYNAVSSFLYLETVDLRCKMEHAIASDCITANLAKTRLIVSLCLPDGGRVRRAR